MDVSDFFTINKNFGWYTFELQAFIDSIDLMESLVGNNQNILLKFIIKRLDGKTLEIVPNAVKTVEKIKEEPKDKR